MTRGAVTFTILSPEPENGRQPKDTMDHTQSLNTKPARLRRSRAVRSPRPRALTRAIERGADPVIAVHQWRDSGGSMQQLVKRAQGRQS